VSILVVSVIVMVFVTMVVFIMIAAILIAAGTPITITAMILRLARFAALVITGARTPVAGKRYRAQRKYQHKAQHQTNYYPIFPAHANTPFPLLSINFVPYTQTKKLTRERMNRRSCTRSKAWKESIQGRDDKIHYKESGISLIFKTPADRTGRSR